MSVDATTLWREIAADLHTLGALDETRRRVERDLQAKRDMLLEAGVNPDTDRQVVTDHGTVTLAPGPVTRRRGVDTMYLDVHYEDLPADVRGMCTVTDTVTIDMGAVDFDDVQVLEGIVDRAGGRRDVRRRWPTVRDLEHRLPDGVRDEAIVGQERGTPILILDAGGVKVQA